MAITRLHALPLPLLLLLAAATGASARAQEAPAAGSRVTIVVHDSLSARPLAGATVQMVSATDPTAFGRSGDTDSLGRYVFAAIPAGRYTVGFMHPLLDTLGIEAPARRLEVADGRPARLELAVPSPGRLRAAICGPQGANDSSAAMIGTVRDPRDLMPVAGATVHGGWLEITFVTGSMRQRPAGLTATTGDNGWFALCGLPSGTVTVTARHAGDSTHALEFPLQPGELRRRDLYVAMQGRGRISGRIVSADSVRALGGARVSIVDGASTTADAAGRWELAGVPLGTRMMEVKAIGYYPERRPVDVVSSGEPLEVALTTFQAVLEAVRVTADRVATAYIAEFEQRARSSGMGRYMTADRIQAQNPINTSDLFRMMPGFIGDGSIEMKSNFSDGGGNFGVNCTPEVYIDGHLMRGIGAIELDGLVKPEHIAGIEVYSAGSPKPPQFDSGMSGCGAVAIWQKPVSERFRRRR